MNGSEEREDLPETGMEETYLPADAKVMASDGSVTEEETVLLREHELNIIVNETPVMSLICTKQDLYELVLGRLITSGLIGKAEDVSKIIFCRYLTEASVFLNKTIDFEKARAEEKSCCTGNRILYSPKNGEEMKKLPKPEFRPEWIFAQARRFEKGTLLHDRTACTHSCMLARKGEILYICEDIGRHNAIDKAVGYGVKAGIPLSECILYTSGRVPVDMAQKAIAAGIPVLASKSVPTAEAVELARQYGLMIIGNARPYRMKVFA